MDDRPTDSAVLSRKKGSETGGAGGEEMPRGMERRLVLRLLSHWRQLIGACQFPSFADLDPLAIPDIWEHSFVLDVAGCADDPIFRLAGPGYAAYSPVSLANLPISQVPNDTLVQKSVEFVQEVIAKEVPISRGGEFIRPGGARVLYRGIILPMSDDGQTVSGLLGAANCREEAIEDQA